MTIAEMWQAWHDELNALQTRYEEWLAWYNANWKDRVLPVWLEDVPTMERGEYGYTLKRMAREVDNKHSAYLYVRDAIRLLKALLTGPVSWSPPITVSGNGNVFVRGDKEKTFQIESNVERILDLAKAVKVIHHKKNQWDYEEIEITDYGRALLSDPEQLPSFFDDHHDQWATITRYRAEIRALRAANTMLRYELVECNDQWKDE